MAQRRQQHSRLLALAEGYNTKCKEIAAVLYSQTHLVSQYQHCCYLAILSYKSSLDLPGLAPQQELNSRLGLGQALYDYTTDISDAEHTAGRALSKASEDDSLDDYLFKAYELHIRISSAKNLRFAQFLLKRAIKDAERKKRQEWFYQFNLLAIKLTSNPTNYFKAVIEAAKRNDDADLHLLALVELARSLAHSGDWRSCAANIEELENEIGYVPLKEEATTRTQSNPDAMDEDIKEPSIRKESGVRSYILLVLLMVKTIFTGRNTEATLAKSCLEEVNELVHNCGGHGSLFEMKVNGCVDKVKYRAPNQRQILEFSFVLNCITHKDPVGSMPVSLICVREGLAFMKDDIGGGIHHQAGSEVEVSKSDRSNVELAIRCSAAQVHIMRREMEDAREQLLEMVKLARKHKVMKLWAPWLLMLEGFLLQASNEEEAAKNYYEAVAILCGKNANTFTSLFHVNSSNVEELQNDEMEVTARISAMTLEVGMNRCDHEAVKAVNERMRYVQCSPSIHAIMKMVEGILSKGIITRSKHLFTQSLTLSSQSHDNYIRAFLFALLNEVFRHSHEDQALQMIQTGYAISRKMGKVEQANGKNFGMPFLNLIYSQSLENYYKRSNMKAELRKQEVYTKFYHKCCDSIADTGYTKSIQLTV
ncbi:hypothetical protein E3P91_03588 [Wallemia ichthyophaga]|nr:hypothetical protein E3P91_03588 [Wallemia ichthyophaga]